MREIKCVSRWKPTTRRGCDTLLKGFWEAFDHTCLLIRTETPPFPSSIPANWTWPVWGAMRVWFAPGLSDPSRCGCSPLPAAGLHKCNGLGSVTSSAASHEQELFKYGGLSVKLKRLCVKFPLTVVTVVDEAGVSACMVSSHVANTWRMHTFRVHRATTEEKNKKEEISRAISGSVFCGPRSSVMESELCSLSSPLCEVCLERIHLKKESMSEMETLELGFQIFSL